MATHVYNAFYDAIVEASNRNRPKPHAIMDTVERVESLKQVIRKIGEATGYDYEHHLVFGKYSDESPLKRMAASYVEEAERAFIDQYKPQILSHALYLAIEELEHVKRAVLEEPNIPGSAESVIRDLIKEYGTEHVRRVIQLEVDDLDWGAFVEEDKEDGFLAEEVHPSQALELFDLDDLGFDARAMAQLKRKRIRTLEDLQKYVLKYLDNNPRATWKEALKSIKFVGEGTIRQFVDGLDRRGILPNQIFEPDEIASPER